MPSLIDILIGALSTQQQTPLTGALMPPATPGVFNDWYNSLPQERQFSPTTLNPEQEAHYQLWKQQHGLYEKAPNEYDLRGWYQRVMQSGGPATIMVRNPDGTTTPHTASIGLNGKILKSTEAPTFHMTALSELIREAGIDEGEINSDAIKTPQDSESELNRILMKYGRR